jgi:WD40 repeat protein
MIMLTRWWPVVGALCLALPLAADPQKTTEPQNSRLDQEGNPLPEGALLRIGSTRIRSSGSAQSLAFVPNGNKLVSIDVSTGVHLWDVGLGSELRQFGRFAWRDPCAAVSSDGSRAALAEAPDSCRVYDTGAGREIRSMKLPGAAQAKALALSPNGQFLACAGVDSVIRVWAIATGKLLRQWELNTGAERQGVSLACSPDNKTFAVGTRANGIYVLGLFDGKQDSIANQDGAEGCLIFSPTGKYLAAMPRDGRHFTLWDIAAAKPLHDFPLDHGSYWCAAFTPDGKSVVTGNYPGKICFWDLATGKLDRVIAGHQGEVESLTFSMDGKRLATGSGGCTVRIWDTETGKQLQVFAGAHATILQTRFGDDGKTILSISNPWYGARCQEGAALRLWDSTTGLALREVDRHPKRNPAWRLTGDGRKIAVADDSGAIRLYDLASGKEELAIKVPEGEEVNALQMTREGSFLAAVAQTAAKNGRNVEQASSFHVWNTASGNLVLSFKGKSGEDLSCRFTGDDRYLAVQTSVYPTVAPVNGLARQTTTVGPPTVSFALWDFRVGRRVLRPGTPIAMTQLGVASPSGRLVATPDDHSDGPVTHGELMILRETATGQPVPLPAGRERIGCLAFSPDGRTFALGTRDGDVLLWDLAGQTTLAKLSGHRGAIVSTDFSSDGKRVVSGGDDTTIVVWDVSRWTDQKMKGDLPLDPDMAARQWADLSSPETSKAYASITRLLRSPKEAVEILRQQLRPVERGQTKDIATWIEDLDSPRYADREQAMAKLQKLGNMALPALDKALASEPPLEVRSRLTLLLSKIESQHLSAEWLQALRGLEVLELLSTKEAVTLLETLAQGAPEAWLTQEAAATFERVRKRVGQ